METTGGNMTDQATLQKGHIQSFIDSYAAGFEKHGLEFCERHATGLKQLASEALGRNSGRVFILGNGGCHAIARCFRHAFLSRLGGHARRRVVAPVDPDAYSCSGAIPGPPFAEMLHHEGLNNNDLIVLLSGSGDSENLVRVAKEVTQSGVRVFALVGCGESAIGSVLPAGRCLSVELRDQQLSEDIIQYASCLLGVGTDSPTAIEEAFLRQAARLAKLDSEFVFRLSASLAKSFAAADRVRVMGLGHPALAACAEHTAHNLNWDAFYEVDREPDVTIISTPSGCDYSGISNDRRGSFLRHFAKAYGSIDESTTLVYSLKGDDHRINELGIEASGRSSNAFLVCGEARTKQNLLSYCVHSTDPFDLASLSQCTGHIVGRVLRYRLLESQALGESDLTVNRPIGEFLIQGDLAQRRLLGKE